MARLIRSRDWSSTALGPIESWPQSLKTTVSLCLASNFPINIIWGPEHVQIYNDGYLVLCGASHPQALGEPYTTTWASAWPAIGEPFEQALTGKTSFLENQRMFLSRNGYLEETFFTFSTSPIRDESGGIGGLFHPVTETTATMLSERRTRTLRDVHIELADVKSMSGIAARALQCLQRAAFDIPYLAFYELVPHDMSYACVAQAGIGSLHTLPSSVDVDTPVPFSLREALKSTEPTAISGLAPLFDGTTCGPYEDAPDQAFLLPVRVPGIEHPVAMVLAGVSARLPVDNAYRVFFALLTATLAAGYANARTYEEERQKIEALAALDKAKIDFFSNVSHEFRTPLTLMLGPLEDALLQAQDLPAAQQESLTVAHRNALRLLKLVNSLLDFARLESGRTHASFQATDINVLTAELASNFRSACERAGLDLDIQVTPGLQPVFVDREMWEKIVLNLLSNAFKFTLKGGIRVAITQDADAAVLTVSDTGTGIADDQQALVFQRFHRIENQQGRTFEGTGIGLSLVDELVRLHGGTISLESKHGTGTTFTVSIPTGSSHLPADRIGAEHTLLSTGVRTQAYVEEALRWLPDNDEHHQHAMVAPHDIKGGPAPRILLADDNADMRDYIARILTDGGYEVLTVDNGSSALEAARKTRPDLILSDVMMPGLDGFALLEAVRKDPELGNPVFMLLSARAGEEARVEGLTAGADDYLVKPFNARELRARIDGAVSLARQRQAAQSRERDLLEKANREREALVVQFHQMQKMETIGQLTGGVAHDFNNLLTPIFASLEMLKRRLDGDDRATRMANAGLQCAERAKVLVSRLLAFARKQTLDPRPTHLRQLIVSMQDLLKRSLESNIELVLELDHVRRLSMVDANQVELALLNLCLNARDAMPSGGVLRVRLSNSCAENVPDISATTSGYLKVSVIDNGIGMDDETRTRAIEPFFSTKGTKGTGLGLSMVHGVVAQMGGYIQIESAVGIGTQVHLFLPASEAIPDDEAPAPDNAVAEPRIASILVVDDEDLVRMTIMDMLEDEGYVLTQARSGEHALELIRSGLQPDLLLTDFKMPGIDGSQLATEAVTLVANLAVLVITGFAALEVDWPSLAKPFTHADLIGSVREQLQQA
ncbi:response regulator [Pseudomonas sp. CDFA 602]|uniref:ATP-binding protein n=1 Tax=Pseudomonas californiensis TaxID=2829823 RepID=UPI001E365BAB|nr:ATP-binding protein [Pseudomonas californiensis]MCD5993899.1 response regulator [Pseudomonas californiensis]MCD5999598.1 response regulator [Pseudomonas californiensis]